MHVNLCWSSATVVDRNRLQGIKTFDNGERRSSCLIIINISIKFMYELWQDHSTCSYFWMQIVISCFL